MRDIFVNMDVYVSPKKYAPAIKPKRPGTI